MCSSPKSSTRRRRHIKKSQFSRTDYEQYASMVRRASAVYDEIELRKAEMKHKIASQQPVTINESTKLTKENAKMQTSILIVIKDFLLKPMF